MGRSTERIGRSGEYFTASILSLISDTVLIVPHGAEADIVFDYKNKIYKCQVKTKSKKGKYKSSWRFDLRRGSHSKSRAFKKNSIDLFALVSLEYMNVLFFPYQKKGSLYIKEEEMKEKESIKSFHEAMKLVS